MNNFIEKGRAIVNSHNQNRTSVPYYAVYNLFTGSPQATILLAQISYWWSKNERKPFYKFKMPCGHKAYKKGDSWTEELLFTEYQFDGAIKKIGTKVKAGGSKEEVLKDSLVIYWIDRDRMTWFQLNESLFFSLVGIAYEDPSRLANQEKPGYGNLEKADYSNQKKPDYISTSENTTKINNTLGVDLFVELFGEDKPQIVSEFSAMDLQSEEGRERMQISLMTKRAAKMSNEPWLSFNQGKYKDREGINAVDLQRVDYMICEGSGLTCRSEKMWNRWLRDLVALYQEAGGDFKIIKQGIVMGWEREPKYRPGNPAGFVVYVRKMIASKPQEQTAGQPRADGRVSIRQLVSVSDEGEK